MLELRSNAEFVIFTTRDYAAASGASMSSASRHLDALAKRGAIVRVTKGIWANTAHPHFHPLACVPYLLGKEQGYVSFLTALHLHGMISQIPRTLQVATTGRPRVLDSPIGKFEFLRIKPELMSDGVDWSDTYQPYLMASAEKALLDTLYISTRKNRRFVSLPELDMDGAFHRRKFDGLLNQLPYAVRIRSAIASRWQHLQESRGQFT
ncbi:MAG: type IV toxin-antitoxin system AbiEi family antitoxin domain-containing protein [Proteobacteria bacterium]|nr:type IV toxin-antitoxin system AbiEi family antitoxin domain-containing protein [Pseudomonadota bacterium]MDA0994807.1 type IV toxin-antitoxin system AbiEi family antitoxin domain-containing protein [Pseudomonadota bacterium]